MTTHVVDATKGIPSLKNVAPKQVPREVVRCALRNPGVDKWLIRTVMALYTEACTVV